MDDKIKLGIADLIHKYILKLKNKNLIKTSRIENISFKEFANKENIKNNIRYAPWSSKRKIKEYENEENQNEIIFSDDFEDNLFKFLIDYENTKTIYHYTDFNTLLSIISQKKLRLSCIAGLNDRAEFEMLVNPRGKKLKNPFNAKRIESVNRRFIISCSENKDHLNSWRLYGDDGKGVNIEFEIEQNKLNKNKYYFAVGKVLYGDELIRLTDRLSGDINNKHSYNLSFFRFYLWRNFLKSKHYQEEKEVRLLYYRKKRSVGKKIHWKINKFGILNSFVEFDLNDSFFPLKIKGFTIGPKCNESLLNEMQLKYYLKKNRQLSKLNVYTSSITDYR